MDAVLLSGFVRVPGGAALLDMGTGTGILPLLLSAKTPAGRITGLEIQPESADMARRSVELNGLSEKIRIITGDIKEADRIFGAASFEVISCNPPYIAGGAGLQNPDAPRAIARHEICCTFLDVAEQAAKLLVPGGKLFVVHRPDRLSELLVTLTGCGLEPKRLRIVYPFADKEPNMVLIEAARGGRKGITLEKPLIIYEAPGRYSEEIRRDYGF
ncbi:MAG: tRNA1(Val) (adenine(37)-N6)-methyltransferase [Lachnospiraceae bacterium]|nr:tRNA1(Val) (adenine(37)-N6)-methyltransferase [Lachnospiraceae bacterium]